MRICTFNIQNDFKTYKRVKTDMILKFIYDNNIDIVGLQEVFIKANHDIKKNIKKEYKMVGKYRFFFMPFFLTSNEKTPIITKHKIEGHKTYHLPFLPSHLKRVMTHALINYNGHLISIYNTHIEYHNDIVKEKQLNKILDIIKHDKFPKIIMGDFNLKENNPLFKKFVANLLDMNINKVDIDSKTYKYSKDNRAIDHVFLSDNFKVKSFEVVKNIVTSDHYPVLLDIEIKK